MRNEMSSKRVMLALLGGLMLAGADDARGQSTVRREDVKTWVIEVDGKEYEARPATPAFDGTTGLFHLPSAYTLPRKRVSFSLFRSNVDRDPKDEDISVHGVTLGYGLSDKVELSLSYGLQNRIDADALIQPGFVNDYPFVSTGWETGSGDLKLGAKFKFLDDYGSDPVGLAVRGFFKLPTASEDKGLGTGKSSTDLDLILSKSLGRKADLHAAIGYQWNSDPEEPRAVDIGNAFKWGLGLNVPTFCRVQVQAELVGTNYGDADFEQTNPIDFVIGPVIFLGKGIFLRPAISHNFAFDDRGLNSGAKSATGWNVSVGYHPGTKGRAIEIPAPAPPPPPPPPPAPPANRAPTVACDPSTASVKPGETVSLRANASDADNDTLTYAWTTSGGGRISGSAAAVQLDTTGVTGPANINATVRVTDGRGGSAESTCNLRVAAPERSAEVMTCGATGFPRNRARLNNVDKACLDDVALRLREDPRSRVVIVGHADRNELRPELLSRQRAEATKTYLTTERGVDGARVSTRGDGASKAPSSAGQSNRRVEVIFVPEGATLPSQD